MAKLVGTFPRIGEFAKAKAIADSLQPGFEEICSSLGVMNAEADE
jgi:hypothetical protein